MKIVALLPVKNEAWILKAHLDSVLRVADHIIALDDNSTDDTREILAQDPRVTLLSASDFIKNETRVDMSLRRNVLLDQARKIGATHQLWLDADEIIPENYASKLRNTITELTPGQRLWLPWITLWKKPTVSRVDSVWKNLRKDFVFCDDGISTFGAAELSESRTPHIPPTHSAANSVYTHIGAINTDIHAHTPVLHFQFVNWKKSEIKQAWYMCHEFLQKQRNARRINATYSVSIDSPSVRVREISYLSDAEKIALERITKNLKGFDMTETSQYKDLIKWFDIYSIEYFEKLNIWHIEELHALFINRTGRNPRIEIFPDWLIRLNSVRHSVGSFVHHKIFSPDFSFSTIFENMKKFSKNSKDIFNATKTAKSAARKISKKIIAHLPYPLSAWPVRVYENRGVKKALVYKNQHEPIEYQDMHKLRDFKNSGEASNTSNKKINILFYHVSALSFGGTEKFLQIIAKYLNPDKFNVYIMYSAKPRTSSGNMTLDGRRSYISEYSHINLIEFSYEEIFCTYPYILKNPSPNIFKIIKDNDIDLVFTAGSGYAEYPFNLLTNIPVILINIFGSPTAASNIKKIISISQAVDAKIRNIIPKDKREIMYIQSEKPDIKFVDKAFRLREKLGISPDDFVFGRIGRADDSIFDPIALNAFKKFSGLNPDIAAYTHYIIMSPAPAAKKLAADSQIQNVHFIDASAKEEDVWAFHYSLDALAHFRLDGESFGLNIAESMLAGNPIITHKSHIWNAHLEYLEPEFSFIVEKDDVDAYAQAMKKLVELKSGDKVAKETFLKMKLKAQDVGEKLFIMENNIGKIERIIEDVVESAA